MSDQYVEVPKEILTDKDLNYLSDMFEWNYGALKKTNESISNTDDLEIITLLEKACSLFDSNLNLVLDILGEREDVNNG
ncbi:MAG: hypothetical protein PUC82_05040 [bacterium]|nr:hypothetical protein [bacterium]